MSCEREKKASVRRKRTMVEVASVSWGAVLGMRWTKHGWAPCSHFRIHGTCMLLEGCVDQGRRHLEGRCPCRSSHSGHAQTPHCNVHGSLALALLHRAALGTLSISLRLHLHMIDLDRGLRHQTTHLSPITPAKGKIMPQTESVLAIGDQLYLVFCIRTSL